MRAIDLPKCKQCGLYALQVAWRIVIDPRVFIGLLAGMGFWLLLVGAFPTTRPGIVSSLTPGAALYLWEGLHPLARWLWRLLVGGLTLVCVARLGYTLWPQGLMPPIGPTKIHMALTFPMDAALDETGALWNRLASHARRVGWRWRGVSQEGEGILVGAMRPLWQRLWAACLYGGGILIAVGSLVFLRGSWAYASLPIVVGQRFAWQIPRPVAITLKELHLGYDAQKGLFPLWAVLEIREGEGPPQLLEVRSGLGARYAGLRVTMSGDFPAVRIVALGEEAHPLTLLPMAESRDQGPLQRITFTEPKEHLFGIAGADILLRLAAAWEGSIPRIQLQVLDGQQGVVLAETLVEREASLPLNGITIQAAAERAIAFTLWYTPGFAWFLAGLLLALLGGMAHLRWGGLSAWLGLACDAERKVWVAFASTPGWMAGRSLKALHGAWQMEEKSDR